MTDTAAATNTTVDGGTLNWRSTGSPGNTPLVGSGGVLDFSRAPGTVALGGAATATIAGGGAWRDPNSRVARPYLLAFERATLAEVQIDVGTGQTVEVQA